MPKFIVCRTFCELWRWTVEADNEKAALSMLDDDEKTPSELAKKIWLGAFEQHGTEMEDSCYPADSVIGFEVPNG